MKVTKTMVESFFPQLAEVKDRNLVSAACEIWVEAFEKSSWENIEDCQFATRAPGVSLIKHTESVTEHALVIAKNTIKKYGYSTRGKQFILEAT